MRMPLWVAGPCIILGAVLGALVAWGLHGEPAAKPVAVSEEPTFADRPWDEPPRRDRQAPALPPPVVSHELNPEVSSTEAPSQPEPAAVPVFSAGDGVITGRVIDQQQRGIADAEVVLVLSTDAPAPTEPQRREFASDAAYEQAYLQFTAQRLRHYAAITRRTLSGQDGDFTLDQLPDVEGRISANAEGYRFQQRVEHRSVKPGTEITLEGVRLGGLRVIAAYPDGSAPESGHVRIQREDGPGRATSRAWESLKGEPIELDPGTYRATFTGRERPGTGLSESVEVREGEISEVRIEVQELARVKLTLEFGAARPSTSRITLYNVSDDGSRGSRETARSVRAPSVEAEIGDVEPGDYLLVLRSGGTDLAEERVRLRVGVQEQTLKADQPASGDYLDVTVNVPASGNWQGENASVRVSGPVQGVDTWHLGENRFRVYYAVRAGRRGNFTASASISGLGSLSQQFEPERDSAVEFTFHEPATLTVRVLNVPEALNVRSLRLALSAEDGSTRLRSFQSVAVPGKPREALVRFRSGQPLSGVLRFAWAELSRLPGLEMAVNLQPGHSELQWALPELHSLTVTVELGEGVSRASLRLSAPDDSLIGTRTVRQSGQQTTFSYLVPGAYNLRVTGIGGGGRQDYPIQIYGDSEQRVSVMRS